MAKEKAPWAVDGALHSAAVARTLAYASTSGAEGIVGPLDMEVTATPAPSGSVAVAPGAVIILNRADSGGQQSYTARNVSETLVEVQPTGSAGGRTDYVWAYVADPEFPGVQEPESPEDAEYFFLVAQPNRPEGNGWYALARIDIPANTIAITDEMITDLREVANPLEKTVMFPRPVVNGHIDGWSHTLRHKRGNISGDIDATRGEEFPDQGNGGRFDTVVPEWATRMMIEARWTSVRYNGLSSWGGMYVHYRGADGVERSTQDFGWDTHEGAVYKTNWILSDNLYIPAGMRGGPISFYLRAFIENSGGAKPGAVTLDARSGLHFQVRFMQVADWTGWNVS